MDCGYAGSNHCSCYIFTVDSQLLCSKGRRPSPFLKNKAGASIKQWANNSPASQTGRNAELLHKGKHRQCVLNPHLRSKWEQKQFDLFEFSFPPRKRKHLYKEQTLKSRLKNSSPFYSFSCLNFFDHVPLDLKKKSIVFSSICTYGGRIVHPDHISSGSAIINGSNDPKASHHSR